MERSRLPGVRSARPPMAHNRGFGPTWRHRIGLKDETMKTTKQTALLATWDVSPLPAPAQGDGMESRETAWRSQATP